MKKIKLFIHWFPEIVLILITLYYWLDTGKLWNPFAISLMLFLLVHICLNKRVVGIVLSIIFGLMTTYLFIAWYSDIIKFKVYDEKAKDFIYFGLIYIGTLFITSAWIMGRYLLSEHKKQDLNSLTQ